MTDPHKIANSLTEAQRAAEERLDRIMGVAERFARIMGGHFVFDPAQVEAFKAAEVKRILEEQNNDH